MAERDSPEDLFPFAQALVRTLLKEKGLRWSSHRVEDAEQDLFLAGWQDYQDEGEVGLAKMVPKAVTKRTKSDNREHDLINRKIKATVAMLADPTFDSLDELRTTLGELKAKRDAVEARRKPTDPPATPALTEKELRTWALEQFSRLDELATRTTVDLKDRQMVEAFVDRIEVNPDAKTGVVYLMADLEGALLRSSTRGPLGEEME